MSRAGRNGSASMGAVKNRPEGDIAPSGSGLADAADGLHGVIERMGRPGMRRTPIAANGREILPGSSVVRHGEPIFFDESNDFLLMALFDEQGENVSDPVGRGARLELSFASDIGQKNLFENGFEINSLEVSH